MKIVEFHSFEQQDEFIYNLFDEKTDGTFIDVASAHPVIGSNSYTLEKIGWKGFSFDVIDARTTWYWDRVRSTPFIHIDATSIAFTEYLKNTIGPGQVIDYASVDVDFRINVEHTNISLLALNRILDSGIVFKAITFEHEKWMFSTGVQNASKMLLEQRGYVCLFENVVYTNSDKPFEDWWINPAYIDPKILDIKKNGESYTNCVEALRNYRGSHISYQSQHNCCRAFPTEYRYFYTFEEQWDLTNNLFHIPQPVIKYVE